MLHKLSIVIVTFWVGSLWVTGLTASILFDVIQDGELAGEVAGHLFAVVSYIGLWLVFIITTLVSSEKCNL